MSHTGEPIHYAVSFCYGENEDGKFEAKESSHLFPPDNILQRQIKKLGDIWDQDRANVIKFRKQTEDDAVTIGCLRVLLKDSNKSNSALRGWVTRYKREKEAQE